MRKSLNATTILLCLLLLSNSCVNDETALPPVQSTSFKLANGNPISEAAYDDYNPILLQLSNGYLALVFASTRTCSGCTNHNIFVASSVTAYNNDAKLPAFNAPQVVTFNTAPLSYSTRLRLAAVTSGNNINVFVKDASGLISHTGLISPISAVPIASSISAIAAAAYCGSYILLGFDAAGLMIATSGTSGPISRFDPSNGGAMCPTNIVTNTALASTVNISTVRSSEIGIAEGFLVTDSAGRLTAQTATNSGPVIQTFSDTMSRNSLFLTSATVFKANLAAGDLLVFSAAPSAGANSDMYIIANKTPSALWLKYTPYGTQPHP